MALHWNWEEKIGEATLVIKDDTGSDKEATLSLYKGNAFLIFLHEYKDENGVDMYNLWSFWADKEHAKNCLGLNKKQGYTENMYERPYSRLNRFRFNKGKNIYVKDLVPLLAQAFDNITIEIFSDEEA